MFNCIDLVFKEQKIEPMTDSEYIDEILYFAGKGSKVTIMKEPGFFIAAVAHGGGIVPKGKEQWALAYTANSALHTLWLALAKIAYEGATIE